MVKNHAIFLACKQIIFHRENGSSINFIISRYSEFKQWWFLPILYNTFKPMCASYNLLPTGTSLPSSTPLLTDFLGFLPAAFYLCHSHNLWAANLFHNDHYQEVLHHPWVGHPVFQSTSPEAVGWGASRFCWPRTWQCLWEEQIVQGYLVSQTNSALVFIYRSQFANPTLCSSLPVQSTWNLHIMHNYSLSKLLFKLSIFV